MKSFAMKSFARETASGQRGGAWSAVLYMTELGNDRATAKISNNLLT
jgi:hypothetical protein